MMVRCGRCGTELEVSGPGEFLCPSCGTRNVVRDPAPSPADLGGLTVPGGTPGPPAPAQDSSVSWSTCPSCSFRFAMGDVEKVVCPNCGTELEVTEAGLRPAGG